jgi:hypothetical protein
MAMTDLFFTLRRLARDLRGTNNGEPVTRGELAGFFEELATEGSTVHEVVTYNPEELGGEDYGISEQAKKGPADLSDGFDSALQGDL